MSVSATTPIELVEAAYSALAERVEAARRDLGADLLHLLLLLGHDVVRPLDDPRRVEERLARGEVLDELEALLATYKAQGLDFHALRTRQAHMDGAQAVVVAVHDRIGDCLAELQSQTVGAN